MICEECGRAMVYVEYLGGRLDDECLDYWKCEHCGNTDYDDDMV